MLEGLHQQNGCRENGLDSESFSRQAGCFRLRVALVLAGVIVCLASCWCLSALYVLVGTVSVGLSVCSHEKLTLLPNLELSLWLCVAFLKPFFCVVCACTSHQTCLYGHGGVLFCLESSLSVCSLWMLLQGKAVCVYSYTVEDCLVIEYSTYRWWYRHLLLSKVGRSQATGMLFVFSDWET